MGNNILVFVEQRAGQVKRASLEAVSEASRLAAKLGGQAHAVVVGAGVAGLAAEIGKYGAAKVYTVDDAKLANYAPEAYAKTVAEAAKKSDAAAVFMAATFMGKDLGPTMAAVLGSAVAADCTGVSVDGGKVVARRPVYAGKAYLTVGFRTAPAVLSLRPNVFKAEALAGASSGEPLAVAFTDADFRSAVKEVAAAGQGKVELTEASIIVTGGRGLKGPENWGLVENLAKTLGAAMGATRAVVDLGWRPHAEQVGQTGKTVSPNLYVAIAVSGAIQHQAGMRTSKVIVAINKDADAPIFKFATYGIVGDAFDVVPALTEELKKVLGH
jgi:electron transfer flavoprotein alpha subunit